MTIDARGTQKEIAQTIRAQDADEVGALKGNQGLWHEAVTLLCAWADAPQYRDLVHQTYETPHTGHGRAERRRTAVPTDLTGLRGAADWMGVQAVAMGEAWRTQGETAS